MSNKLVVEDSWGIASLRQCSGFVDENEYVAPVGCCLVQWNLNTKKNSLSQIHDDLITVMVPSLFGNILTVGYGGEVKLWNKTFEMMASFQSLTDNTVYGCWSMDGSRCAIASKGPNQKVLVYNYEKVILEYRKQEKINAEWSYVAPQMEQEQGEISYTQQTEYIQGGNSRPSYDCFNAAIFKANNDVICVYQSRRICELFLFTGEGVLSKRSIVSPLGDDEDNMLCVSQIHDNILAVGLQHGVFGFYDADTLELLRVIQATGTPHVCLWNNDVLAAMSFTSGIMTMWSTEGHLIKEIKGGPTGSIVQMNIDIHDNSVYYIGGIMSLHKIVIKQNEETMTRIQDLSYLSLTGCGVAVNEDGMVASGDFTGNVFVWRQHQSLPKATINIGSSVRCLLWVHTNLLLIGTLSAELFCWYLSMEPTNTNIDKHNKSDVKNLYNFIGDVVIMKCDSKQTKIAVGTTAGYLYMFSILENQGEFGIHEDYAVQIHEPRKQMDDSLLNMEIWSLTWSLDDQYIATSSEDRTTIISNSLTGDAIQTLSGHTSAVTSVVWQKLSNGPNLLITCADDQTVRIYDGVKYDLLHVVDTYDIYGWHTLTYLSINTTKDLLFVSTQNGYIVVWDLKTLYRIHCKKMHSGSIEGMTLSPDQQTLVTVGSDCVVNCFSLADFVNPLDIL